MDALKRLWTATLAATGAAFRPPFHGLAPILWLYFVWCFLVHPDSAIRRGAFVDPDDYLYLTQTIDWLKGQSWFDAHVYRLDPPEGVALHFSRLVQAALAALILPFRALGLPWTGAATLAAAIWPLLLLAVYFVVLRRMAARFLPPDWTRATAFTGLFATATLFRFTPGNVDHHGLEYLLALAATTAVIRLRQTPEDWRAGLTAGALLAFAQAIGLEGALWVLLLSGWMLVWLMACGAPARRGALAFGGALFVLSALLLVTTRPPEYWTRFDWLGNSAAYLLLAGGAAAALGAAALASLNRHAAPRWIAGTGVVLGAAVALLRAFPELARGPYGAMDPALADLMFRAIGEATPLRHLEPSVAGLLLTLSFPLLGLAVCLQRLKRDVSRRADWLLLALLLFVALALATFWQQRLLAYAMLFAVVPLTVLLREGLRAVRERWRGRRLFAAEAGLALLAGPLLTVVLPAVTDGRAFNTGVLLFPVQRAERDLCDDPALDQALNAPPFLAGRPLRVMNMMDQAGRLLFRTPHAVLAAPYHVNPRGNLDAAAFFGTTDPAKAEAIARRRGVDLVLFCRRVSRVYLGEAGPGQFRVNAEGLPEPLPTASFTEQLLYGKTPSWLEPLPIKGTRQFLVFRVR